MRGRAGLIRSLQFVFHFSATPTLSACAVPGKLKLDENVFAIGIGHWRKISRIQKFAHLTPPPWQGRARHSVRAIGPIPYTRRARGDAPCLEGFMGNCHGFLTAHWDPEPTAFGVHASACPRSPSTLKGGHQTPGSWRASTIQESRIGTMNPKEHQSSRQRMECGGPSLRFGRRATAPTRVGALHALRESAAAGAIRPCGSWRGCTAVFFRAVGRALATGYATSFDTMH